MFRLNLEDETRQHNKQTIKHVSFFHLQQNIIFRNMQREIFRCVGANALMQHRSKRGLTAVTLLSLLLY